MKSFPHQGLGAQATAAGANAPAAAADEGVYNSLGGGSGATCKAGGADGSAGCGGAPARRRRGGERGGVGERDLEPVAND